MASTPHNIRPKFSSGTKTPGMVLHYISGQGMVFRSSMFYETCTKIAIGMYLRKICGDLGMCEHGCTFNGDDFLNLRGTVADCKMMDSACSAPMYQVTLLFDDIGERDLELLKQIERERRNRTRVRVREKMVMGLN